MNNEFECNATAAMLESGAVIAHASNACAVFAGIGCILSATAPPRLALGVSLLAWIVGCWLAARVAIDAKLFRALAESPDNLAPDLDTLLIHWGFIQQPRHSTLRDRTRGALKLWRAGITLLMLQITAAAIALVMAGAAR